jgi:hypothetical protein
MSMWVKPEAELSPADVSGQPILPQDEILSFA